MSVAWLVAVCCTSGSARSTKEMEMRRAVMSIQEGVATYVGDMTVENVELGDFGACRRR